MTGLGRLRTHQPRIRLAGRKRSIGRWRSPLPRDVVGFQGGKRWIGANGERGAATLIALALSGVVIMAALVTADLGALAVARARAQTAADLAALAAVAPAGGDSAVDRATEIAAANGAGMTRCTCEPMEAVISVHRRVLLPPFGVPVEVRAYARAVLPGPDTAVLARPAPASRVIEVGELAGQPDHPVAARLSAGALPAPRPGLLAGSGPGWRGAHPGQARAP